MRALSVRQPWAELIASGKKKVEYRSWQREFRGDLLIVASSSRHDDDCADEGLDPERLVYGAAVCVVDFWKVTGDQGDYSWHVRAPRRVEAVPVKGYASIYHVDDRLLRFAKAARSPTAVRPKPRKPSAVSRLPGRPAVVLAARDPKNVRRWGRALVEIGCRVTSFRDGYTAWLHLEARPAACVLLDVDVQGYSATEVLARMRQTRALATTPVVFVGGPSVAKRARLSRVGRSASADDVVRAVRDALAVGSA
ncbi:MAG: ASCH domain-containing protein [Labilithrix sp.]|nr:ASCH domain-containing protein [Labilithrix sp.]